MEQPELGDITNLHYLERLVLQDEIFMGTIEAAMRAVAVTVYAEPPETEGHEQRAAIALNIALSDVGTGEARRFRNIFATAVIQDPGLRSEFFDTTTPGIPLEERIKPWLMTQANLDFFILSLWNVAANVRVAPEPEGETA